MTDFQVLVSKPTSDSVPGRGVRVTAQTVTIEADFYEVDGKCLNFYVGADVIEQFQEGEWFGLSEPMPQ